MKHLRSEIVKSVREYYRRKGTVEPTVFSVKEKKVTVIPAVDPENEKQLSQVRDYLSQDMPEVIYIVAECYFVQAKSNKEFEEMIEDPNFKVANQTEKKEAIIIVEITPAVTTLMKADINEERALNDFGEEPLTGILLGRLKKIIPFETGKTLN